MFGRASEAPKVVSWPRVSPVLAPVWHTTNPAQTLPVLREREQDGSFVVERLAVCETPLSLEVMNREGA